MLEIIVSTLGSTSLIALAVWLSRALIKERLTASIHLETEQQLAKFKSELESTNQRIRDIASFGTAANSQVESVLVEHRIAAVKKVWESVQRWQQVSDVTMMVSTFSNEWIQNNASNPKTKSSFEQLLKGIDHISFLNKQNETELERPFLSESAWATYSAYHSFLSTRLIKASLLMISDINHAEIFSEINERDLLAKSAPAEILAIYDKSHYAGTEPYLSFLRERMLVEFRDFLSGQRAGNQAVKDAAQVLHAAEELAAKSQTSSLEVQQHKNA